MWHSSIQNNFFENFIYCDNLLDFSYWASRIKLVDTPTTVNPLIAKRRLDTADDMVIFLIDHANDHCENFTDLQLALITARRNAIYDENQFSEGNAELRLEWLESSDPEAVYLRAMRRINLVVSAIQQHPLEYFSEPSNIVKLKRELEIADFLVTLTPQQLTMEFDATAKRLEQLHKLTKLQYIETQRRNWYFVLTAVREVVLSTHRLLSQKEDDAYVALGDISRTKSTLMHSIKLYHKAYSQLVWVQIQRCIDLKEILELQEFRAPIGLHS